MYVLSVDDSTNESKKAGGAKGDSKISVSLS
jgi:hypothetical protein